jgi:hypothetical protein
MLLRNARPITCTKRGTVVVNSGRLDVDCTQTDRERLAGSTNTTRRKSLTDCSIYTMIDQQTTDLFVKIIEMSAGTYRSKDMDQCLYP